MSTGEITDWLQTLTALLPGVVAILATLLVAAGLLLLVLGLLDRRRIARQNSVFLELTPPANTDKTPEATQRLFAVLYGLEASRTIWERLSRRKVAFTLELVSTKREGIRYVLRVPAGDATTFEQTILSYLPDAKLRKVEDYLPERRNVRVLDIKQTSHFGYPLHTQLLLQEHDPMAYLTGVMTKLSPSELICFQLVVSPANVREAGVIRGHLLHNEELVYKLGKSKLRGGRLFDGINTVLFGITDGVGDMVSGPSKYKAPTQSNHQQQVAAKQKPARVLSSFEQRLAESVNDKLGQPLFQTSIRVLIAMDDTARATVGQGSARVASLAGRAEIPVTAGTANVSSDSSPLSPICLPTPLAVVLPP